MMVLVEEEQVVLELELDYLFLEVYQLPLVVEAMLIQDLQHRPHLERGDLEYLRYFPQ